MAVYRCCEEGLGRIACLLPSLVFVCFLFISCAHHPRRCLSAVPQFIGLAFFLHRRHSFLI